MKMMLEVVLGLVDNVEVDRVADMVADIEIPEFLENAKISGPPGIPIFTCCLSHLDRRPVCKRIEDLTNLKVKRRS